MARSPAASASSLAVTASSPTGSAAATSWSQLSTASEVPAGAVAPRMRTTWRRCGSEARRASSLASWAASSTSTTLASAWWTMYCTSSAEQVV